MEQRETMPEAIPERRPASDNLTSGALFGRFRQATGEGGFTQEQLEEMMKQRQQAQAGQPGGQPLQVPTTVSQNLPLREGLTVTVSIITQQKSNALLVPNTAITTTGGRAYVQVLTTDGTAEPRPIQPGISNWQYTEVFSGLSEGELVIVPTATTATRTTQPQFGPGGMGIERMLR